MAIDQLPRGTLDQLPRDRVPRPMPPEEYWKNPGAYGNEGTDSIHLEGPPKPENPKFAAALDRAKKLFPWLLGEGGDDRLLRIWARNWVKAGDDPDAAALATAAMRSSGLFKRQYPGFFDENGVPRFVDEKQYKTVRTGMLAEIEGLGLNPEKFQGLVIRSIEGGLSLDEFKDRVNMAQTQIFDKSKDIQKYYAEFYGTHMTPHSILAAFLDPDIGDAILNKRINIASIAGNASKYTLEFENMQRMASRFYRMGLTGDTSDQFFGQAAIEQPILNKLVRRHRIVGRTDERARVGLNEYAGATFGGDVAAQLRYQRAYREEAASFSEQGWGLTDYGVAGGLTERR